MDALIVTFDDWQALYVNSKKVAEGHRLSLREVFEHLDVGCAVRSVSDDYADHVAVDGYVPDHLDEYPTGALT